MYYINIQPFLLNMLWLYEDRNAQGAFAIIFFIRREFLNYLRSLCSFYNIISGPPPKFQVNIEIQLNTVHVPTLPFRFL